MLSVVIPAFNEDLYLPRTLDHLRRASGLLQAGRGQDIEIIVVDNASTDRTAEVAAASGAKVVRVPEHNIGRVRNAGARAASGDVLIFLDADTLVPEDALTRIAHAMEDPACLGGAADIDHRPSRLPIRLYLRMWRGIGLLFGMAQGAMQFCRREAFATLGGYDESIYMGEDVDFYWRLGKLAKARVEHVRILRGLRVVPSARRFDQWSTWRILVETNPLYITLFRRRGSAWHGWYRDVPR